MTTPFMAHPYTMGDASLDHLRHLMSIKGFDASPTLAEWILAWIATEQLARREGSHDRTKQHVIALPPASSWTDAQVADALGMSCTLSYVPGLPDDLSPFVDRVAQCIVGVSCGRLRERARADVG